MRILDKNNDFYDFYQNVYRDDSIVFDRIDSFELTKERILHDLDLYGARPNRRTWIHSEPHSYDFLLLQIGCTYWLFQTELFRKDKEPDHFTIALLRSWKNYDKPRRLISLEIVSNLGIMGLFYNSKPLTKKEIDDAVHAIDSNQHKSRCSLCYHSYKSGGEWKEKHIPLLKSCGIGALIDPLDAYLAFEEYFGMEKTVSERCESVGLTNNERITNHGFDTKTSFRGKNN